MQKYNYLRASEVAMRLGISRQRVYELAYKGRIGIRIGGYWCFRDDEVDRYAAQRHSNKGGRPCISEILEGLGYVGDVP